MNDTTFQGDGKVAYVPVVVNNKPPKPITNYDRLVSKSPEELAEWLANQVDCQYCSVRSEWCTENEAACRRNWLDWLKQEASYGN